MCLTLFVIQKLGNLETMVSGKFDAASKSNLQSTPARVDIVPQYMQLQLLQDGCFSPACWFEHACLGKNTQTLWQL